MSQSAHEVVSTVNDLTRDDPRISHRFVSTVLQDDAHPVVLVGTVHDHPASAFRVRTLVSEIEPAYTAVELPPAAIPLFEQLIVQNSEFGAACAASRDSSEVVGIDGFGLSFAKHFARMSLEMTGIQSGDVLNALKSVWSIQKETATMRLKGSGEQATAFDYDVTGWSDPIDQAESEVAEVKDHEALMGAFNTPDAQKLLDTSREEHMAEEIDSLRQDGVVVAVVGYAHMDKIEQKLNGGEN